jgi:prepilin-type N-terminal cleavage/methylation domain-containing protein
MNNSFSMHQFKAQAQAQAQAKSKSKSQVGLTLIETLVALAIFALVVSGALALFGSASSSQTTTQLKSDLSAIRAATKSLYFGQGGYGSASLVEVLINGNKVPTTMSISGTAPARVINNSQSGTVTVTGATSQFTVAVTNISTDVCVGLVAATGWSSVQIGAATALTSFPIAPTTASTQCAASNPVAITFMSL